MYIYMRVCVCVYAQWVFFFSILRSHWRKLCVYTDTHTYAHIYIALRYSCWFIGLPWWLRCKESACNVGDLGSIPESGRSPGGGHGNPLQYSCLKNSREQRNLTGYSAWGHKELDKWNSKGSQMGLNTERMEKKYLNKFQDCSFSSCFAISSTIWKALYEQSVSRGNKILFFVKSKAHSDW